MPSDLKKLVERVPGRKARRDDERVDNNLQESEPWIKRAQVIPTCSCTSLGLTHPSGLPATEMLRKSSTVALLSGTEKSLRIYMFSMLWLGLNFPLRRLWFGSQNREELFPDIRDVATTSFQGIGVVIVFGDFPLKRIVSATINIFNVKVKNLGDFIVLGKEQNPFGKEGLILVKVATNKRAIDRLAFNDVRARYKRLGHDSCC